MERLKAITECHWKQSPSTAIDNSAARHLLQIREMPNSSLSPEPLASHCPNEAQNNAHSRQCANPQCKQVPLDLSIRADMIALDSFSSDRVKDIWLSICFLQINAVVPVLATIADTHFVYNVVKYHMLPMIFFNIKCMNLAAIAFSLTIFQQASCYMDPFTCPGFSENSS